MSFRGSDKVVEGVRRLWNNQVENTVPKNAPEFLSDQNGQAN